MYRAPMPDVDDARITAGVQTLQAVFGDRLCSVMLVGAALDAGRPDRMQHPGLLTIVQSVSSADLLGVANGLRTEMRHGLRVRTLTRDELVNAADVFALEVAEWQARYHVLAGGDLLADLVVEREHLRLGIERRLRGLGRQLRNRVLMAVATGDALRRGERVRMAGGSVREALNSLVIVARHALSFTGQDVPAGRADVLAALVASADLPQSSAVALRGMLEQGQDGDVLLALDALLPVIDGAARWVDQLST